MFDQLFLSIQVEGSVIISNKNGIYEFPYELLNNMKLRILKNEQISWKLPNFIAQYPVFCFAMYFIKFNQRKFQYFYFQRNSFHSFNTS